MPPPPPGRDTVSHTPAAPLCFPGAHPYPPTGLQTSQSILALKCAGSGRHSLGCSSLAQGS